MNYDNFSEFVDVYFKDRNDGLVDSSSMLLSTVIPDLQFVPDEDEKLRYDFDISFKDYADIPILFGASIIVEPINNSVIVRSVQLDILDEDGVSIGNPIVSVFYIAMTCHNN